MSTCHAAITIRSDAAATQRDSEKLQLCTLETSFDAEESLMHGSARADVVDHSDKVAAI